MPVMITSITSITNIMNIPIPTGKNAGAVMRIIMRMRRNVAAAITTTGMNIIMKRPAIQAVNLTR